MNEELEPAFRALADAHRRRLLDRLREQDGQTLGELEAALPSMTRFGVMKHLRVLEDAHLVTTRRDGRRKLHYLNPVPIRLISDRWISRYAAPFVDGMADLKYSLEAEPPMTAPAQVYEVFIRTTPERLWQALTDGELTKQYYYDTELRSDLRVGSPFRYFDDDDNLLLDGTVVETDPPRRLVTTFSALWGPEVAADPPSRLTWEIEPMGAVCRLRMIHDELAPDSATFHEVAGGWSQILSGLKTLLETGEPLVVTPPESAEVG
ncbi:MAG TPA: SRPBCC domain-containing protein [Candidatus Limnocylindria bacterium]|nr:SRPBCC domain-containing protein [Candidatus Limnocylindria bacterium]